MSAPRRPVSPHRARDGRPAGQVQRSGQAQKSGQVQRSRTGAGQELDRPAAPVRDSATLRPAGGAPRPAPPRVRPAKSATPKSSSARPSSTRPAARTGGTGGANGSGGGRGNRTEHVQQRVPRLFTVRTMVLLVVVSLAFILVFPTLRSYLDQQVELQQLRAEVAAAEHRNDDLQAELDRWSDPAYVEAQARERLAYVMPGERALRVADPETITDQQPPADETSAGVTIDSDPTRPWYAQIWDSVQIAGAAGTGDADGAGSPDGADPGTGDSGDNGAGDGPGTDEPTG